jgi:glycosyltransferase involved in cell wall biosynthesis
MKILAFTRYDKRNLALACLRLFWPLEALARKHDWPCICLGEDDVREIIRRKDENRILGYDLYIFQRLMHEGGGSFEMVEAVHSWGGKCVFEIDDDLTDRYRWFGNSEGLRQTLQGFDAITVSTPALAGLMKEYGLPIYVLPNHLNTRFFREASLNGIRDSEKLTIGLIGTRSHWGDWQLPLDALVRLQRDYDVEIMCGGYVPPYLEDNIEDLQVYGPVNYRIYPALVRQVDILLCPLDWGDQFNHSKSGISALDAMAAARPLNGKMGGAVAVCSDCKVYRRVVNHRNNGILVKDGDWYSAIAELIENTGLRRKISVNGLKWVAANRDIKQGVARWAKAYQEIMGG